MQVKKEIFEGQTSTNEVFSNQGQHECHRTRTGVDNFNEPTASNCSHHDLAVDTKCHLIWVVCSQIVGKEGRIQTVIIFYLK
jgi:hypothetical protein